MRATTRECDPLASNRTLLVWLRAYLGCAGLRFAVAKFSRTADSRSP